MRNQNAYRHMIVEHAINAASTYKRRNYSLKRERFKTEPAFAQVLNIDGDPYEGLIVLGQEMRLW